MPFVLAGVARFCRAFAPVANASVRIRRPEICKLACKAKGERIFTEGEIPGSDFENRNFIPCIERIFHPVFRLLVDRTDVLWYTEQERPRYRDREEIMKKKTIVALAFCALILATTIAFIVFAIDTYRMEMNDPADIWAGMGTVLVVFVGGFIVFYECDLFYTVYYLFFGQKRTVKTVLVILANITLLLIFVYSYLSDRYMELRKYEITPLVLFAVYIILKIVASFFSISAFNQESE